MRKNGNYKLEFEYRDLWGNLRTAFTDSDSLAVSGVYPSPVISQINDFDLLGFEHFNNQQGKNNKLFQNQERIFDLELNVDFFKYRVSDPVFGRFWGVDPLGSDFPHNSLYAFQENKFAKGVELEGAELAEFGKWLDKKVDQVLSWTDVDDATVIATHFTRNGNAIHVDGTPATKTDKYIAAGGVLLPFISGSTANKLTKKAISYLDSGDKLASSSKAARREAMREAGIPTSQALIPDKATKSKDKVFLTRDGKNTVQDAKNDISHSGQPHWEAGPTKPNSNDPEGFVRGGSGRSTSNKPQMGKPKSKVYYEEK